MTIALIDGDIIAYRCAASCEPSQTRPDRHPLDQAILRTEELLYRILDSLDTQEYLMFLSGSDNFRKIIDPSYKANRTAPPPTHLSDLQTYLYLEWKAKFTEGYEADDALGIHTGEDTVIVSIDKDLNQIEGPHYNFVYNNFYVVDELSAQKVIYKQMLMGDRSDNIIGLAGIGEVKSKRIVESFEDVEELHKHVYELYNDPEWFIKNYYLVKILRSETEYDSIKEYIDANSKCQEQGKETSTNSERQDSIEISVVD